MRLLCESNADGDDRMDDVNVPGAWSLYRLPRPAVVIGLEHDHYFEAIDQSIELKKLEEELRKIHKNLNRTINVYSQN